MISLSSIIKMVKDFYSVSSKTEKEIKSVGDSQSTEPTPTPNTEFYQKGSNILNSNGWVHKNNYWVHHSYPDFKIYEKNGVYEITPENHDYKILKIVKTEKILIRIKEYDIYLNSKKVRINKDSFLSDFE